MRGNVLGVEAAPVDAGEHVGAGAGMTVKYRDADRLNLRQDNLYLAGGSASAREYSAARNHAKPSADWAVS